MTTEQEIKEALDGWFYSFDFENGTVTCTAVARNHIPTHRPRWWEIGIEALRANGNAHNWDDDQDDLIVARRASGVAFGLIGKEMGLSESCVVKRYKVICTQRGIRPARRAARTRKYSPEIEARIVELRQGGKTFSDIAHILKLPRAAVYEIYRTYRVHCEKYRSQERKAA